MECFGMLVNLSWLELHPNETEVFHLERDVSKLARKDDLGIRGTLFVDLEVTNTGRLMIGQGFINAVVEHTCARCLTAFEEHIVVPFTVEFCSVKNREHYKEEESFIYFDDPEVNIEDVVLENIILYLPLRAVCSSDCKGICAGCGQDLNQNECQCQGPDIDPRWEALKKML